MGAIGAVGAMGATGAVGTVVLRAMGTIVLSSIVSRQLTRQLVPYPYVETIGRECPVVVPT